MNTAQIQFIWFKMHTAGGSADKGIQHIWPLMLAPGKCVTLGDTCYLWASFPSYYKMQGAGQTHL